MTTYCAGIIGLGQIGCLIDDDPARDVLWSHAGAYQRHSEIEVAAVCDVEQSSLDSYRQRYGSARQYRDYREMLATEKLDIVSVCTPTASHGDVVHAALEAGTVKAVFCEKPMALTASVARPIVDACRRHGVVLAVNYMRRWDPVYLSVQELLASGSLGQLRTITAYGATALLTSTSHLIDAMLMFGGPAAWVCGDLQEDFVRQVHNDKDPGGVALIKFQDSIHGFLKGTSASRRHYMFDLDLLLTEGRIVITEDGRCLRTYRFESVDTPTGSGYMSLVPLESVGSPPPGERMLIALDDILDCIRTGRAPCSNGETATAVLELISGIKESDARDSVPVTL
jgi:predicted dehydrogenase